MKRPEDLPRVRLAEDGPDGKPKMLIVPCWPVDTSDLPADLRDMAMAKIDDTIIECGTCDEQCWCGPRKLDLVRAGMALPVCKYCLDAVAALRARLGVEALRWSDLHSDRVERFRTGGARG